MIQHLGSSLLESVGQLLMLPGLGWALTVWCQGAWVICTGTLLFVWGRTLPHQPVFLTAETCSTPVGCSEYGFDLFSCSGCGDQVQGCLADTPGQQWLCNLHTLLSFFLFLPFSTLAPTFLCPNLLLDKQPIPNYFFPICASLGTFTPIFGISVTLA